MPIDLSKVSAGDSNPLIDPRDVFAAISRRPWPFLRHEQGEVLEGWFANRNHKDVVLKQNTGGGKTAVGLLIAQSSLNEGFGPAVYLVPDTYLVEQVEEEAKKLEIETVSEPSDRKFIAGTAVLVNTLKKLINGISAFGVDGTNREIVDVGTIVVDDAHAALAEVESQFALTIPREHDFYDELFALFKSELTEQSASLTRELEDEVFSALMRVPFWSWRSKQQQVLDVLLPYTDEKAFKFAWPLIRDQLDLCSVIFTGTAVDIRPPAPPIHKIPAFTNARRRIYMTATLADDTVLTQDLGVDPVFIETAITPKRASDIGNRVILAPLELNPSLDPDAIRVFAKQYATGWPNKKGKPTQPPINVIVLVPSDHAAKAWAPYANATWNVDDLKTGVPKLRAGHVGLVVLANKYDGIDLPGPACRLLIIDGLPSVLDAVERREASSMIRSPRVLARQVQRVEQGMGRGVRDSTDYCAVLLMGSALTRVVHDPKQRNLFSPATQKQLELSSSLSTQLTGGLGDVRDAVDLCLSQNKDWLSKDRTALATTEYRSAGVIRPAVVASRAAFDKAVAHDFARAEALIQDAAQLTNDPIEKGWLLEQQAVYRDVRDASTAQQILLNAMSYNHHVLHPVGAASLPKTRAAGQQAEAVGQYFSETYVDALDANLGIRDLFDRMVWDEKHSKDCEKVWEEVGLLLGFGSERPEIKYGTGPDNLWAMNNGKDIAFELKTGALDQPIKKDDVDQFGGHLRWYAQKYGDVPQGVMIHKSAEYDSRGTMPEGARIMTEQNVLDLRAALLEFTMALNKAAWSEPARVSQALADRNLTLDRLVQAFTTKPSVSTRSL